MLLTLFAQLLNLVWMFCVDMAPCWRSPGHVHAWRAILLARGMVRSFLAAGTVFESTAGMFFGMRSDIFPVKLAANLPGNYTIKIEIFITNRRYPSWDQPDRTGAGNPTNSALYLHELQMDGI